METQVVHLQQISKQQIEPHRDMVNQVREMKTTEDTSRLRVTSLQLYNQCQNKTKSRKAYLDKSI
jgi:hypothetical protein